MTGKRLLMLAVCGYALLGAPRGSDAQVIGFKIGPTFSTVDNDNLDTEEGTLTSFGGGGFIRFGLFGISIQPEILVITKGFDVDLSIAEAFQAKLDYIEVPVLARFGFGSRAFAPYVMAGPTFSFEYGCNIELDNGDEDENFDCEDDEFSPIRMPTKSFDFGLTGVFGVEFGAGPGSLLLEGRYTHGFTDISDVEDADMKNRSFAVFVGYSVPLTLR